MSNNNTSLSSKELSSPERWIKHHQQNTKDHNSQNLGVQSLANIRANCIILQDRVNKGQPFPSWASSPTGVNYYSYYTKEKLEGLIKSCNIDGQTPEQYAKKNNIDLGHGEDRRAQARTIEKKENSMKPRIQRMAESLKKNLSNIFNKDPNINQSPSRTNSLKQKTHNSPKRP